MVFEKESEILIHTEREREKRGEERRGGKGRGGEG